MNKSGPSPDPTFDRVREVLLEVAGLPHEKQVEVAKERLDTEPETLSRVLRMLERLADTPDFLESGLTDKLESGAPGKTHSQQLDAGSKIAHFELIEKIGQGGMAVVFRARQFEPVDREVALKVIGAFSTDVQKERFQRECRMLARFSHPNIATMYESGVTASGELFVAMELVEGLPISQWCRENTVSAETRIRLIIDACNAVAHAHNKGVLHRDIKPSNIMVTIKGGQPLVKVIDFGIASALNQDIDQQATLTGQHLIGTPAYMSPEAVTVSSREQLDARSDVYALAVVLFELLCGTTPYKVADLPMAQWFRKLTQQDAPRLATVFSALQSGEQTRLARQAKTHVTSLKRFLGSDIEVVLRKAMSIDPAQRYETSRDLAEDLDRFLQGKPVIAHPPSRIYLARRFVRRHWIGAGATVMLVLSLLGGVIASQMEARETRLALDESEAVSRFLIDLLEHASPLRTTGEDVVLRDIIDTGAEQLEAQFVDHPAIRARLLHTLGRVYGEQGDYERGAELMAEARQVSIDQGLADSEAYLQLLSDLGVALRRKGHLDEAETVLKEALAYTGEYVDSNPLLVADIANSLGNVYVVSEEFDLAEEQHAYALTLREANLPEGHLDITSSRNNLASVYINSWNVEKALPYAQQVLRDWLVSLPPNHPWLGVARGNLAIAYDRLGRHAEATEQLELALEEAEKRLGPNHPDIADYWRNLAAQYTTVGDYEKQEMAWARHISILSEALGPNAPRTLAAELRGNLEFDFRDHKYAEVLKKLDSIRDRLKQGEHDAHLMLRIEASRVRNLIGLEKLEEARELFSEQQQTILQRYSPGDRLYNTYARIEGELLAAEGHFEEAFTILENLETQVAAQYPPPSSPHILVTTELARAYFASGDFESAAMWARLASDEADSINRRAELPDALIILGFSCLALSDGDCAQAAFTRADEVAGGFFPPDHFLNLEIARGLNETSRLH